MSRHEFDAKRLVKRKEWEDFISRKEFEDFKNSIQKTIKSIEEGEG